MTETAQFYVYMLRCSDGSLYTGWSTDVAKRLETHNSGKGAKYTRGRRPVCLLKQWAFETKADALRFEIEIKKMTRADKENLLAQ